MAKIVITRESVIKYVVTPYSGTAWVFAKRKDAVSKYREERESDPTMFVMKVTETTYVETEEING